MNKAIAFALIAAGLFTGQAAQAQSWGIYVGSDDRHYPAYDPYRDDGMIRSICSGQRAYSLENKLRHEEYEDEIDPGDARRIHSEIDRLEDKQRHECDEGDWRAVRGLAYRYDRIGQWIDAEAHGYDRRGW